MNEDVYYVAARRVLLDALEDLQGHSDAIIVVGAQAVYLRTGAANVGIAEYTTDGDLAVNADRLADLPLLGDRMGQRFDHVRGSGGAQQPGVWSQTVEVNGQQVAIPVDLIVPEGIAPPGGRRGAQLGSHGNRAARKAVGLEAAILDNGFITIEALDPDDHRRIESRVAGPTALLLSKAHKIHDRLDPTSRPDRLADKDASDVYRLMQTTTAIEVNTVVPMLLADPRIAGSAARGLEFLRELFGARRGPGVEMAVRALRLGVPEERVRTVCVGFMAAIDRP